jgi:hypothetical protein
MGTDYILTRFAHLAALVGAGRSNFIKVVCLNLVSGMILAGAPIALTFSPTRNDLPYKELSINFAFKISRAVQWMIAWRDAGESNDQTIEIY